MKASDGGRRGGRPRVVSYANVVSTLALFVALGGGAWAALALPAHSVGARELAHGAVTADKLHRGAVTAAAVRPGSLTGRLFRRGSITADVLAAGPRGRVPSARSADQAAISQVRYVAVSSPSPAQSTTKAQSSCPAGFAAVGGGLLLADPNNQLVIDSGPLTPQPVSGQTGWQGHVSNIGGGPSSFTVVAVCARAASSLDTAQIQYARHAKFAVPLYHWRDSFCADLDPEGNRRCGAHGQRPIAFVADGTHASYPSRCATPFQCFQPRTVLPEGDYSGDVPWPGNDRANAVVPFHNGPENGWQFWKGNWNKDPHVRVKSPGNQDRYAATSNDPRATVVSARAGRSQPYADCASWIAGAQVAVCDPVALKRAAEAFDFGSPGTVSITTLPGASFDSSPGLAQTMGDPLTVGQHVDITGRSGTRTFIEVTYIVGTYLTTADLPAGLENGGTAHLSITPAGASIMLPDGRVATGRVIIARDLAQPAPPEISLRRLGRTQHARLNVVSQTPTVEVVFRDRHTRRIGPLHTRIVLVGRARGLRFILPRSAFYLSVQSLDAHGKRSLASYVVIDPARSRRHREQR